MLTEKQLQNFAELAVRVGANMQKGQEVVIRCDVNCQDFEIGRASCRERV